MVRPRLYRLFFTFLAFALLLLCLNKSAAAQTFEPATSGFTAELRVWTSGGVTYAKARLTFPNTGYRVSDWGQVERVGNNFVADAKVERYTGGSGQMIMFKENTYTLGTLPSGTYTFTFKSYGTTISSKQFDPSQVMERWEPVTLPGNEIGVRIFSPNGITYTKIEFYFPDTGYSVTDWGKVTRSGNEFSVDIKAERWTGESQARTTLVDHDYELGALNSATYTLTIKMHGTTVRTLTFAISSTSTSVPKLMTEENSERAIALDSVTWLRYFPLMTTSNFSSDGRARIMLLVSNMELSSNESPSLVTAQAEDASHKTYPLTVEYVGKVPGFDWLTQVIVKPTDDLKSGGDIWITINLRGIPSNKGLVTLKPSN
ncbi:MAG TPA: hypothetical protein VF791_05130 [Pyrinomonadaceae bacterium]